MDFSLVPMIDPSVLHIIYVFAGSATCTVLVSSPDDLKDVAIHVSKDVLEPLMAIPLDKLTSTCERFLNIPNGNLTLFPDEGYDTDIHLLQDIVWCA